ncbi:DUF6879 family protein [Streptomyces sp. NPDC000594]|uniref:DUF6879 family protein n=1 Tax=Streptomyces sp. NPDC000594 TaxID=3154261 RepID=UPI00332D8567
MSDPGPPRFDRSRGKFLRLDDYEADFAAHQKTTLNQHGWKFERLQHFEETSASRNALRRGDWEESLRLLEDDRPELLEDSAYDRERGHYFHRVRVAEEPLTPYMQWELHALRVQAECGLKIRVIPADAIGGIEKRLLLPEVVILGDQVLYDVVYRDTGETEGAVRFTDPELIGPWVSFIEGFFAVGEDMLTYFDRVVAPLPPPRLSGE